MSLVLSKIELSPLSPDAIRLVASPDALHSMIYRLFDEAESGRILFRAEYEAKGPHVLIQSAVEPAWDRLQLNDRDLRTRPQSKPFEIRLNAGQALQFRLLTRPMVTRSTGTGNPRAPRKDLRSPEERLAWLQRKGERHGFGLTHCDLTMVTMPSVHSAVDFRTKGGSFTAVQFDGHLVVLDPDRLREAVQTGIGPQKGFGLGLLSLSRG